MCLDSVKDKLTPNTLIQSGWKEFNGSQAVPEFAAYSFKKGKIVPLDQWLNAEGTKISMGTFKSYEAGFHIYEDEEELKHRKQRRVFYRNVHTRGRQDNLTVVIAKEMYVPSDPNAWPPKG